MSTTTNIGLFKHDNPSTNKDIFDVDKALNQNWDKTDKAFGEDRERLDLLEASNTISHYKGKVDAILLTGGMARDTELCDKLAEYISWIAPIYNYAVSFETEALGFGAIRVLKGDEEAKTYTGKPVWNGFPWDKE